MKPLFLLMLFICLLVSYVIFSYSLTAPNLILSSWQPYWQFQTWIWRTLFNNRPLLTNTYLAVITSLWLSYSLVVLIGKKWLTSLSMRSATVVVLLVSVPLVLASNALSYDIFNYLFNAKMMVVYHANPHQSVALDYGYDDWTRFMHNTHTPAPYGYGWSLLSLVPYSLGFGKLLSTWLSFKAFSWLSYFLLAVLTWHNSTKNQRWLVWLTLLNPLLLIEVVGNSHNDLWMLVPALASLLLVLNKLTSFKVVASLALLAVSISIKLASVAVAPIWLVLVAGPLVLDKVKPKSLLARALNFAQEQWAWLASVALFLPLMTERSKYFLPWYITWALVWLPFFTVPKLKPLAQLQRLWQCLLIGFSISSLYRYLPFLSQGNYDGQVVPHQIAITWIGGVVGTIILFLALNIAKPKK
jgi:hypothetical protein